jgi:hypothetical protein
MPIRSSKFTDSNLRLFYGNLLSHYKECVKKPVDTDVHSVYMELFQATQYAVDSPRGSLNHLAMWEKEKVYTAFHTIFYALPLFKSQTLEQQRQFIPPHSKPYSFKIPRLNTHTTALAHNSLIGPL